MSLYGAGKAPATPKNVGGGTVAALTEAAGAIGGTNDGDLPDIGTVTATYVQAEIVAIRDAVREVADKVNDLMTHMNDGGR